MTVRFNALFNEEVSGKGATHEAVITTADLSEATAATAEAVALFTPAADQVVELIKVEVTTGLSDASDGDFDDVTVSVGDTGDVDRLGAAAQVASGNGSVVSAAAGTGTRYVYDGATAVNATVTPESGKANADLDGGELRFLFHVS